VRTMLYSRQFPLGKVFDTEPNKADPHISRAPSDAVDNPDKLLLTTDDIVNAAVDAELARQTAERDELEDEFKKKTGATHIHFAAKDETLIKTLDTPLIKRGPGRPRKAA